MDCGSCLQGHLEYKTIPECGICRLPQELRNPDRVTSKVMPQAEKALRAYNLLNHPAIVNRGLQGLALQTVWGDMTQPEAELFLYSLTVLDEDVDSESRSKSQS